MIKFLVYPNIRRAGQGRLVELPTAGSSRQQVEDLCAALQSMPNIGDVYVEVTDTKPRSVPAEPQQ